MMRRLVLGIALVSFAPGMALAGTPTNPLRKPTVAPPAATAPAPAPVTSPAAAAVATPPLAATKVTTSSPAIDEGLRALVETARNAKRSKGAAAWQAVLLVDPVHSEALFHLAVNDMASKRSADAMARLRLLAKQTHPDALEFLIEARLHAAFDTVRALPEFRELVGLDRAPSTPYEILMGHGGGWEQSGTACDQAEVRLQLRQPRTFSLRVTTRCQGHSEALKFRGTWSLAPVPAQGVQLHFGKPGKGDAKAASDDASCVVAPVADEYSLTCAIDDDLTLTLLPSRR